MIFPHDRFSASGPVWIPMTVRDRDNIRNLVKILEKKFSSFIGNLIEVHKVKGLEINSSNFMMQGSISSIVIKLLNIQDSSAFNSHKQIYEHIKHMKLPGPHIIGVDDGQLLGQPYIAMEYIPGQYFSGSKIDLSLTGHAIQDLHNGFSNFKGLSFSELPVLQSNPNKILTKFLKHKDAWDSKFDKDLLLMLQKNVNLLIETEAKCSGNISMLLKEEKSIFHVDLHPHNIIIGDSQAVVIDVDSLKKVAWPSALGFCFYKLSRQVIALQGTEKTNYSDLKDFFETIVSRYGISENKVNLCFLGGLTEILRRILIILEGNLGSKISPWNQVLEIQIKAISEIYFLYDKVFGYNYNKNIAEIGL